MMMTAPSAVAEVSNEEGVGSFLELSLPYWRKHSKLFPAMCGFSSLRIKSSPHVAGELLCCEACPQAFHLRCIGGPLVPYTTCTLLPAPTWGVIFTCTLALAPKVTGLSSFWNIAHEPLRRCRPGGSTRGQVDLRALPCGPAGGRPAAAGAACTPAAAVVAPGAAATATGPGAAAATATTAARSRCVNLILPMCMYNLHSFEC